MRDESQKKALLRASEPTLRHLPWYLSSAKLFRQLGECYVSSTQISKEINIDASQIAKDLSYVTTLVRYHTVISQVILQVVVVLPVRERNITCASQ